MAALTVWTREELRAREEVFQALVAKALRLSARGLVAQVDGLLTAAAAPSPLGIEPEPEARSAAFTLALGELGTVQATWSARVDGELWPYLTQTFTDAAADTAKLALDVTGRSGPAPTQSLIAQVLAFLRTKLLALGGWLEQKLSTQLRTGYDAGDGARQLAARVKAAAADALPVAANGAADALGWAATLGELTQLQAAGFTDQEVEKEWLASHDARVRPAHADADGQRVGLFQSFDVGGEQLFAPRDPTGRSDNVLGCRCGLGYVFSDVSDESDAAVAADDTVGNNDPVTAAADPDWDDSEHPRAPKGTGIGGQFIKKGTTVSPTGTTAYGKAAAKKVAKSTAAQVKAQVEAAKIPVGAPLHVNTNVIYKTKYDDGAVVAVNPANATRLRWDAGQKKFLHQTRQPAGHWQTTAAYGKGDAYKKFSKEDGWHAPHTSTSAPAPKLSAPVSPSVPPPSVVPDGGVPPLTQLSPKAVVAWLDDLPQEDYDELTPFDKAYIDSVVVTQSAFDGGATQKIVDKLKAGEGGAWTPPPSTPVPTSTPTLPTVAAVPLKINTAVVYKTKYEHGAVVVERPDGPGGLPERLIWDADKKKFTLERRLSTGDWAKVKDYNKGQTYKTFSDDEGWFAPGAIAAVPVSPTPVPPVTPAATTSHKKTVPDFSKMSPSQVDTWFDALTKAEFDALSAEDKIYISDHAYGEALFDHTFPQDKLTALIEGKTSPSSAATYGSHEPTDLRWEDGGPKIDGSFSLAVKYPKIPLENPKKASSDDFYVAGYTTFGEGNEVKLYDVNQVYVKSLHSDDLPEMKQLITDEVNAGGGKIVASDDDDDDDDDDVSTPTSPAPTSPPPPLPPSTKYTPGVIPKQKDQLSGYVHQELIPAGDIGKPDTTYTGEYPAVDQVTMSVMQTGMLSNAGKKWTPQEIQAVQRYTTSVGYQTTNAVLRNDQTRMNMFSIAQLQDGVKNAQALQSAMTPTVVTGLKVFRGTGAQAFGAPGNSMSLADLKKLEGKVISDPGFVSTTILDQKSTGFDYTKKPIRMEIEVPPGTPGLYVSSATPGYASENEFILAAGTSFEIMEVRAATPAEKAAHSDALEHIVRVRVVASKASAGAPTAVASPPPVAAPTSSVASKLVTSVPGKIAPVPAGVGNFGATGLPIALNTGVIYKTKYADGAVVAVRVWSDSQAERLVWLNSKFVLQSWNPAATGVNGWVMQSQHTKKDAYATFSKDTGWKMPKFGTTTSTPTDPPSLAPSSAPAPKATPKATPTAAKIAFDVATLQKMHGDLPPEVTDLHKKDFYQHFKNNPKLGTITLGSTPDLVLKSVLDTVKLADDPYDIKLNALQVIKLIDEAGTPPGKTNQQLYEKKLIAWLGTADGAHDAAMIISGGAVKTPGLTELLEAIPKPAALGTPHGNDVSFEELTPSSAATMQQQMHPNTSLTSDARDSLVAYTGSFYNVVNTLLRKGLASFTYGNIPMTLERARLIQESMRPLPRDIVTFRGTTAEQFGLSSLANLDTIKGLIGKTVIDDGFVSSSIDKNNAFSGTIKLTIEAPAGTPARYVGTISTHGHEKELIYAAGTRFKVIAVTQGPYGGTINVRVRVVP